MYEVLKIIDTSIWFIDAIVFAVFFVYLIKEVKVSSTVITLGVIVLLDGIALHYLSTLEAVENPEYVMRVRLGWYAGLAIFHFVTMYAIYKLHYISKTPYSFITRMSFLEYCIFGIMQLVRGAERLTYDTNYLKSLYSDGILYINIITTTIIVIFTISVMISKNRIANGKEGLTWTV